MRGLGVIMAVEEGRQAVAMPSRRALVAAAVAVAEADHGVEVGPGRCMEARVQVKEDDVRVHRRHIH